jgi:outer membrane protein OmpA-like peptidoglycan-associated protein
MKKLVYILFILWGNTAFAQNSLKDKADREFERMRYSLSIEHYEQYLENNTADDSAKLHLAQAYHKVKDTKNAERVFRNISNVENISSKAGLEFAEVLSQNGNYEEAKHWYSKYAHAEDIAKNHVEAKDNIHTFYLDSSRYRIYYLGFNTPQSDFSPSYYQNGIVFASGRIMEHGVRRVFSWDNSAFLDLYFTDTTSIDTTHFVTDRTHTTYSKEELEASTRKKELHHDDTRITSNDTHTLGYHAATFNPDSAWQVAGASANVIPFSSKINSKYHEGPLVFTKDQNTVYFTRNNFRPGKYKTSEEDINELKIYMATKNNKGEWGNITEFVYNDNDFSTGHPALSPDNQSLYFVSNMTGGLGGTDIYVSRWENGKWTKPVNAGNTINTGGNEMFPFVSDDNRLFFASTGHGGLGGLDIFEYDLNENNAEVLNMGFPVNSMKDDFGLIINKSGSTGYFSSNRKRGGTDDDLFMFTRKPVVKEQPKPEEKPVIEVVEVKPEVKPEPKPEIPSEVFNIRNIYFDFDKSFVRADAIPVMNEIVDLLNKYPDLKISLSSHTDSRANHDYNVKLSQRRMNSSVAYLTERGISVDRLVNKLFEGETKLVNDCGDLNQAACNAQQHQLNRRTDFEIIRP